MVFGDAAIPLGQSVDGFPVMFNDIAMVRELPVLVTVGDNSLRRHLQESAEAEGAEIGSFIADASSHFANPPGVGSVILAGAIINAGAIIDRGVILNSGSIVEHDCQIGAFAHLSPGATIAGGARIGAGSWIGMHAAVLPGVVISANVILGAGSVAIRDLDEPGTYVGAPARRIA